MNKIASFVIAALFAVATPASVAAQRACDRACLLQIADGYLAAMVAHDPARAPLAPTVKFTENTVAIKPGDGLWKTAKGVRPRSRFRSPIPWLGRSG